MVDFCLIIAYTICIVRLMEKTKLCNKLRTAFEEILKMPYFENERARSGKTINGHEDAVAIRFEEAGLERLKNEDYPRLQKGSMKRWEELNFDSDYLEFISDTQYKTKANKTFGDMPLGSFIEQPAGSQSFPDFLVRDHNGRFIAIEAKSGRNGENPMWNDSLPKLGAVYILSSGRQNATTLFLGQDVISKAEHDLVRQQEEEIEAVVRKYNKLMEDVDVNKRGWIQKSRKQHFQGGGKAKTNYFTHQDRQRCEQNVLEFVSQ